MAKLVTPLERVESIEVWLSEKNLRALCLIDEFQGAYIYDIEETSAIIGSQGCAFHLIVTDSISPRIGSAYTQCLARSSY